MTLSSMGVAHHPKNSHDLVATVSLHDNSRLGCDTDEEKTVTFIDLPWTTSNEVCIVAESEDTIWSGGLQTMKPILGILLGTKHDLTNNSGSYFDVVLVNPWLK
ncbi:hypothetical protein RUM43_002059 [Polyplax serrata]|uniref:Uncharacterized protein n=1 Tax=Polyplax serrata TaxID=468196 RepID=A0AAN8PD99_POLSC